jgi:hypothetical protein
MAMSWNLAQINGLEEFLDCFVSQKIALGSTWEGNQLRPPALRFVPLDLTAGLIQDF